MKTIKIIQKLVCGTPTFYPNCPLSKSIASIAKQKTLTLGDLQELKNHSDFTPVGKTLILDYAKRKIRSMLVAS